MEIKVIPCPCGKKCISYKNSYLCSDTEEEIINFYNECVENDKKYLNKEK